MLQGANFMIKKQMIQILLLPMLLLLSACGVIGIHEKTGQYFPYTDTVKVKPGMTDSEVMALLGKPYIIGYEDNGDIYYRYEWSETKGQSIVYGLFIMGEQRTIAVKGGSAEIRFAQDTKTVKKIEYKIIGSDAYNRVKRGDNDAPSR
jgi:outer membrane protein assembly factor BamE (lipoprotein component of BamABCDE complex)